MSGTRVGLIVGVLLLLTSCSSSKTATPTGSNGGSSGVGVSIGGETGQGGASGGTSAAAGSIGFGGGSTLTATSATGGATPTGGVGPTGGTTGSGLTGTLSSTGGVVGATGGATATPPGDAILSWSGIPKDANSASEIHVTLRPGAAPLSTEQITLTYCGAGWTGMISVDDITIADQRLQCPSSDTWGDCSYGYSYQLTSTMAVTGTEASCCYALAFESMTHLLHDGLSAMIKLVIFFRSPGEAHSGLDLAKTPTWTVFIDGQRSMSCTLESSTSAAPRCE